MSQANDSREFTRVVTAVSAEISCRDGRKVSGPVRDVSMNGLMIDCASGLLVEDACAVRVHLDADDESRVVDAEGVVVRSEPHALAIEFTSVDADGFDILRRVVLYNASDADRVENELDDHTGLKPRHSKD